MERKLNGTGKFCVLPYVICQTFTRDPLQFSCPPSSDPIDGSVVKSKCYNEDVGIYDTGGTQIRVLNKRIMLVENNDHLEAESIDLVESVYELADERRRTYPL